MNSSPRTSANPRAWGGFSLVEMLAAVAIIGVVTFLAIPNLVRMRGDAERNVAIARAEAINMAMATLIQVRGRTTAAADWAGASTDQAKYTLLTPYLAYAETNLTDYVPGGYTVTFNSLDPLRKVTLKVGTTTIAY
jgi:prepilin-type N-terminal cleavage/methylation domain-containing protein